MAPVGAFHFFAASKAAAKTRQRHKDNVEKGPSRTFEETKERDMPLWPLLPPQYSPRQRKDRVEKGPSRTFEETEKRDMPLWPLLPSQYSPRECKDRVEKGPSRTFEETEKRDMPLWPLLPPQYSPRRRKDRVEKGPSRIFEETKERDIAGWMAGWKAGWMAGWSRHSGLKKDCALQVEQPEETALRPSIFALRSSEYSEAELEEILRRSSKSALEEEVLFLRNGRQECRNLAQHIVTTSHDDGDEAQNLNKQSEQTPPVSIVQGDSQKMSPDDEVPRSLSPSKRQGRGGC